MLRVRNEEMAKVIHDATAPSVFGKIFAEFLFGFRAAVIGILSHVGSEVRIQAGPRPFSMESGLYEVSDQQIVKYFVSDCGHERMARRLKRDAAIKPSLFEFNDVVPSSCPNCNKIETVLQVAD